MVSLPKPRKPGEAPTEPAARPPVKIYKAPPPPKTLAERAAISVMNGKKGGRPRGKRNVLPHGSVQLLEMIRKLQIRSAGKTDEEKAACSDLIYKALEATFRVLDGKVSVKRAPSLNAAAKQLLEFAMMAQERNININATLSTAVAKVAAIIDGEVLPQLPPAQPEKSDEEGQSPSSTEG